MEILKVTAQDWQDYVDDVACCNVILEAYVNDVSERTYALRTETSQHDDVISTMLMTRDSESRICLSRLRDSRQVLSTLFASTLRTSKSLKL